MSKDFKLVSSFQPAGDQPQAIDKLYKGIINGKRDQVLLGVTGSGKTFTLANVIEKYNRPTLVIAPNKTLAAQLFNEFREFFPENAVEYFVSYYDYYQPEAYVPQTDTYIEKDASINDEIDRLRHSATRSLFERKDCIIVASVSCIYGLGSAEAYYGMLLFVEKGKRIKRDALLAKLVEIQYSRNDIAFERGTYRVRGDSVEVFPAYEENRSIRIDFFGDEIEGIAEIDPLTGKIQKSLDRCAIYPNSHYVTPVERLKVAMDNIREELAERLREFKREGKLLEAQRLEQRTMYDLEMIEMMGYCSGIENYSRHLTGRKQGEAPPTLIEYFPKDFLLIIDESHITIPQLIGMYRGDRSRKSTLVEYGFRLPSALDNRPLMFEEFNSYINKVIYVSATPGDYEIQISKGNVVEQIVRPTGLLDPAIEIRPVAEQVDHLHEEIKKRAGVGERVLVTTLTKRMAEHLTEHFQQKGLRVRYMHSDIDTLERIDIIRDLRLGAFDCLIGINLLREGLDLPEVSLVAILDADKEGFLRSERSLIQTFGRAARNLNGKVILYADRMTDSMKRAVAETERRREIQRRYNEEHGITPRGIERRILWIDHAMESAMHLGHEKVSDLYEKYGSPERLNEMIDNLKKEMFKAAANLEFERAAELRDKIKALQAIQLL